ncbi:hypothetical protein H5410_034998 [Solanum commersonii]|uniref:Uncharacterized protein n=1 Tax=Solanum commersonii TaxID=4109 RepID=A0A9J5Y3T2_SOLCO|nr:hypothetical protein H5410_034998 [Solanum commersonii]
MGLVVCNSLRARRQNLVVEVKVDWRGFIWIDLVPSNAHPVPITDVKSLISRPGDRQVPLASRRMAIISPKVPVCQALTKKIKSTRERSSRRVAEWFRDAVLDHPKLQNLRMLKAKAKRR